MSTGGNKVFLEGYFYACCPCCKSTLIQAKNGLDGFIKCGQCGKYIHIVIVNNSVHTKQKETLLIPLETTGKNQQTKNS